MALYPLFWPTQLLDQIFSNPVRFFHILLFLLNWRFESGIEVAGEHIILYRQPGQPDHLHEGPDRNLETTGIRLVLCEDERDLLARRHLRAQVQADIRAE